MTKTLTAIAVLALTTGAAAAQERISIVGSSTVFPFSTTVAEHFGKATEFATPVVESTGSGGGLRLFCAGVGADTPDITNASRRIKASEVAGCAENGVTDITEVKIGYDGIVLANSVEAAQFDLSLRDIFLALAANVPDGNGGTMPNPYTTWAEVNPALPATKIEVMGPPPTSGTRDAFAELAMEGGCKTFDWISELKGEDKSAYKELCHTLREDGAYVEAGENDNLIVQKLAANPDALGIFGYSFLEQNADLVQGSIVNGVAPEFEAIAAGDYPVSRSLYVYVKNAHVGEVPGIAEFVAEFTNEETWGEFGYLAEKGLIPMGEAEMAQFAEDAANLTPLLLD
ncbi:MAG: phosphate ABC transporter substrate-binding protein [Rhodobacteraceae bacterium]|nr:phosphate ABC transporter substrate-binding protein [Paracoccaceae bacterium]